MTERVIIDTDIGTDVDDAYALAFLANSPEVKIEAVTTVWADARLRARIAKKLLIALGRPDIPVAAGENLPLNPDRSAFLMGHEGKGVFEEGEEVALSDVPALELVESVLRKRPKEVSVVLIGPQTNFGKLLSTKPELGALIKQFIIMGGTPFYGLKEMELFGERPIDYNFVADPEAVRIVFDSGVPIILVGCNVTMPTLLREEHLESIRKRNTAATDLLAAMTDIWLNVIGQKETPMHDALACSAAFTLDFLNTMMLNVVIETRGEFTAGLTVVNCYKNAEWNTVKVATDVRREEFIQFMMRRILA
ncbi:MAG: nucleoside hydrolase [Candidatus Abyssobacteria bacterium SURF_5]|uniref:Nucleoside hydrolase n=1 Tax=Abyssobacteria bacterium (strain SURF_5) TaxID=2093360 RepID=A0A3A4NB86_ABYX5|nr:MAG: nucleoside hydrolase [Candidatus Abyssubacteria bacterium SURF_5]